MTMLEEEADFAALRPHLTGTVTLPGDDDYDAERAAWNLAVDQRPAAVVHPADVADVVAVLNAATAAGLSVMAQPNGHAAHAPLTGVVLLRMTAFDEVTIDTERRVARVGAGVNWGGVLAKLGGTGLVAVTGSNPEVSVTGLCLGGGHSLFSRALGLAAQQLTAVELVDADGIERRVTDESDPELMWALRGAGGQFGIVTAVEVALHPVRNLAGGKIVFDVAAGAGLLAATFRLAEAHPRIGFSFSAMNFPPAPFIPEPLRGRSVASVDVVAFDVEDAELGEVHTALKAVDEPIIDAVQPFDFGDFAVIAGEPTDPMPFEDWSAASGGFDDDTAAALLAGFAEASRHGLTRLEVRVLGGAATASPRPSVADVPRAGAYLSASVMGPQSGDAAAVDAAFGALDEAVVGNQGVGIVATFLSREQTLADAYDDASLDRLAALKERVDPRGVIHGNRAIR